MPDLLLVNPRKKRRRRSKARKASRRRRHTAHSFAPRRRRRKNPRSHRAHRRRRHRNPRFGGISMGNIGHMLIPAAIGGVGAIGVDVGLAYLPLPSQLQSGWGNVLAKIAGAFVLGLIGGKVLGKEKGKLITAGALTVTAATVIRGFASQALGGTVKGLSGYSDYADYRMGAYMNPAPVLSGMGAYMPPALPGSGSAAARMGAYMDGTGAYMDGVDGL